MKKTINIVVFFAIAKFILQLIALFQPEFGLFRDELYYLACARHLDWGFVDHPPFSIAMLWVWTSVAGDSLVSLRIISALIGTIPVALTGLITRQLGGEWKAQALACLAVLFAPLQIGVSSFYSMNIIEYALVLLIVWILLRIITEQKSKLWILFGILLSIGIMNKHTFAVLAGFVLIGLLFTPSRKEFLNKYFWIGIGAAFLIVLPNFIWQVSNNFLSLEFYKNASELKNVSTSPVKIILDQFILNNPVTGILWITGLVWLLRAKDRSEFRTLGIAFLLMLVMMMAAQSNRADRIASFIPVLAAAGAVVWEHLNTKRFMKWLIPATAVLLMVIGLPMLPIAMPVLSPASTSEYARNIGLNPGFEKGVSAQLPQNLADRFGWEELADSVNTVLQGLPESERDSVVIIGQNYGQAGALEYYERSWRWPRVICGHNSYWLWGPGEQANVYIVIGRPRSDLEKSFDDVQLAARTSSGWQMNYECGRPIWICRKPKARISDIWDKVKVFI